MRQVLLIVLYKPVSFKRIVHKTLNDSHADTNEISAKSQRDKL